MKARLALLASFLGWMIVLTAPPWASIPRWPFAHTRHVTASPMMFAPPNHSSSWPLSGPDYPRVYFDHGATNSVATAAGGRSISLMESGNTNTGEWVLSSAGGGRTATPVSSFLPGTQVNFTYSDPVMLKGSNGPAGNLYSDLAISFSGKPVSSFSFIAGTAEVSPLPAPPSQALMSSGLLFILAIGKLTSTWSG